MIPRIQDIGVYGAKKLLEFQWLVHIIPCKQRQNYIKFLEIINAYGVPGLDFHFNASLTKRWTKQVIRHSVVHKMCLEILKHLKGNQFKVDAIKKGIDSYKTYTCIRLVPRTNQPSYVTFIDGNGCYSYLGRIGGEQPVSLGPFCDFFHGTVLHEIGHALGIIHEQQRPDRDDYVTQIINREYLGLRSQYDMYPSSQVNNLGFVYDYGSMMHYSATAGSVYWLLPTMTTKDPAALFQIGQRSGFSLCDVEKINTLYGCDAYRTYNPDCLETVPSVPVCSGSDTFSTAAKSPVYRLWNSGNGDHFYTSKASDRDTAQSGGYSTESMTGRCATNRADTSCSCLTILYRLWHKGINNHFYTINANQAENAVKGGYETEPIDCYCVPTQHCGATLPLYRFFNPTINDHFYTTNSDERQSLTNPGSGYQEEGIECYLWN